MPQGNSNRYAVPILVACIAVILSFQSACRRDSHAESGLPSTTQPSVVDSSVYEIVEGRGIAGVAFLGDDIDQVRRKWGEPTSVQTEDLAFFFPGKSYLYYKRGVEFESSWSGTIKSISLMCNTGDTSKFHQTGLVWINPSSVYSTFCGNTSQGLVLHPKLKLEEVYSIYGKPAMLVKGGQTRLDTVSHTHESVIFDFNKAGTLIMYPKAGITFSTFSDLVECVTIQTFP